MFLCPIYRQVLYISGHSLKVFMLKCGLKHCYGFFLSEQFADFFDKYGSRSQISTKWEITVRMFIQYDMIFGENSTAFHLFHWTSGTRTSVLFFEVTDA